VTAPAGLAAFALVLLSCGGGTSDTTGPFKTAAHVSLPRMPSHGGAQLRNLQLVTVTFRGYPFRAFVESFGDFVVHSQWLAAATQDYGPVTATHLGKVVLDSPPGGASSDLAAVLRSNIDSGTLPFPSDPAGLLYLVYAPPPCPGGGYHGSFEHSGKTVAFAVALDCEDGLGAEGVMTHEIAEAASDPFFSGFFFDAAQSPWIGETGDICNLSPPSLEGGYQFLGIWSNAAAASGGSPCVPYTAGPYFNVSPSPATPQTVDAGSSVTFTLTGWSTEPMPGGWPLGAFPDSYAPQDFDPRPVFSRTTINNGAQVTLTLHVPANAPSGAEATVRVTSGNIEVGGVRGFSNDWSLQVRVR